MFLFFFCTEFSEKATLETACKREGRKYLPEPVGGYTLHFWYNRCYSSICAILLKGCQQTAASLAGRHTSTSASCQKFLTETSSFFRDWLNYCLLGKQAHNLKPGKMDLHDPVNPSASQGTRKTDKSSEKSSLKSCKTMECLAVWFENYVKQEFKMYSIVRLIKRLIISTLPTWQAKYKVWRIDFVISLQEQNKSCPVWRGLQLCLPYLLMITRRGTESSCLWNVLYFSMSNQTRRRGVCILRCCSGKVLCTAERS